MRAPSSKRVRFSLFVCLFVWSSQQNSCSEFILIILSTRNVFDCSTQTVGGKLIQTTFSICHEAFHQGSHRKRGTKERTKAMTKLETKKTKQRKKVCCAKCKPENCEFNLGSLFLPTYRRRYCVCTAEVCKSRNLPRHSRKTQQRNNNQHKDKKSKQSCVTTNLCLHWFLLTCCCRCVCCEFKFLLQPKRIFPALQTKYIFGSSKLHCKRNKNETFFF